MEAALRRSHFLFGFLTWDAQGVENAVVVVVVIVRRRRRWLVSGLRVSYAAPVLQTAGARPLQAVGSGAPRALGTPDESLPLGGERERRALITNWLFQVKAEEKTKLKRQTVLNSNVCVCVCVTSLMSTRPAMESLVRGEKCGVIMMRRPASEKDSL